MALESFFNFLFGPIISLGNPWNIIIISFILTLIVNLAMKFFTNQHAMKSLKEDTEYFKKEMQKFKNDPQKLIEIQKRSMETSLKYLQHSLPATLVTLLPLLFIFGWLRQAFPPGVKLLTLPFGISLGWLGSYILFSIIFNIALRKLLKIH
ncbi:MAG: hypothetical protein AABW58_01625 [Nanoarchaeota archaeon]